MYDSQASAVSGGVLTDLKRMGSLKRIEFNEELREDGQTQFGVSVFTLEAFPGLTELQLLIEIDTIGGGAAAAAQLHRFAKRHASLSFTGKTPVQIHKQWRTLLCTTI